MKPISQSNSVPLETSYCQKHAGFTLIEMLVVIAIIVVLAGLLFPVVNGARRKAKEGKAQMQIHSIATAMRAFYNDYALWPNEVSVTNSPVWVSILSGNLGIGPDNVTNNPRKLVYMDFKAADTNSNGILDPWGKAYNIGFDTNYDNQVDIATTNLAVACAACNEPARTNTSFVIWSCGDPKACKVIASWK